MNIVNTRKLKVILTGLPVALAAAAFFAGDGFCCITGGLMEPADHRGLGGEAGGFAMEENEYGLGDVFGAMGIA